MRQSVTIEEDKKLQITLDILHFPIRISHYIYVNIECQVSQSAVGILFSTLHSASTLFVRVH